MSKLLILILLFLPYFAIASSVISEVKYIECSTKNLDKCSWVYKQVITINPLIIDSITIGTTNISFHTNSFVYFSSPNKKVYIPHVTPFYSFHGDCNYQFFHDKSNCKVSYPNSSLPSAKVFKPSKLHKCVVGPDGLCLGVSLMIDNITCYYYDKLYPYVQTSIDFGTNFDADAHIGYIDGTYERDSYNGYTFEFEGLNLIAKDLDEYHCQYNDHWYHINYNSDSNINTNPLSVAELTTLFKDSSGQVKAKYNGFIYSFTEKVDDMHILYDSNPFTGTTQFEVITCNDDGTTDHNVTNWNDFHTWLTIGSNSGKKFFDYVKGNCTVLPFVTRGLNSQYYQVTIDDITQTTTTADVYDYLSLSKIEVSIAKNESFYVSTYLDELCLTPSLTCSYHEDRILVQSSCDGAYVYTDYAHACQITDGACYLNTLNGKVKLLGSSLYCSNTYDTDVVTGWANGVFHVVSGSSWRGYWFTIILIIVSIILLGITLICCSRRRRIKAKWD